MAEVVGATAALMPTDRTRALEANLVAVTGRTDRQRLVRRGYASYARYWAETLRMPTLGPDVLTRGLRVSGYDHIRTARSRGMGPILVLPHLGGWEWAAAYLGRVAEVPVTAVVERLKPADLFDWFTALRSSYGVNVVPLGPAAFGALADAVACGHVVCLLADRDLSGGGVEVRFFGQSVTMPAGPALLARRTGAPIHPTAVYFAASDGQSPLLGHHCVIESAVTPADTGRLRADVAATTQRIAHRLEALIEAAPEQWHVLEPLLTAEADDTGVDDAGVGG